MWIDELAENEIFVFGSNALGHHRGGAARIARDKFGAVWGQGHGLQGRAYAIDSMSGFDVLREEVRKFYAFASERTDLHFLVTPIGTGIAGYSADHIAPLFEHPPHNVTLPQGFVDVLDPSIVRESPTLQGVHAGVPSYVDDYGNQIAPGLMLGGPFDGKQMGMPIFPGASAPQGAGHQVQAEGLSDVVAWYELRTPVPIAERYVYEFDGFRDGHGRKLDIPQGSIGTSAPSAPDLEGGPDAMRALAALRLQLQEVAEMDPSDRKEYRHGIHRLGPLFHPRLWNIDDPVRTEARILRALADVIEDYGQTPPRYRDGEHILRQYLSRARYAQGHWAAAGHPIEMGDYWWAMQLLQLIRARRALADGDTARAIHALIFAVGSSMNVGVDFDYTLEGLAELAFLGYVGPNHPAARDWAEVALGFATKIPDWTPGRWFTPEIRGRLEHILDAAGQLRT